MFCLKSSHAVNSKFGHSKWYKSDRSCCLLTILFNIYLYLFVVISICLLEIYYLKYVTYQWCSLMLHLKILHLNIFINSCNNSYTLDKFQLFSIKCFLFVCLILNLHLWHSSVQCEKIHPLVILTWEDRRNGEQVPSE